MRVCKKCGVEYEHFGQKAYICRPCKRIYDREFHSKRSPESRKKKIEMQRDRYQGNREKIYNYLLDNPCEVCGEDDPVVLEFDHLDRDEKEYTIAYMTTHSWNKIEKEISKCRVLCANCHRRHTAVQLGWYNYIPV